MEIAEGELRRLRSGPGAQDEQRQFFVRARFTAEDPVQVIANARAVLTCVVEQVADWPAFDRWQQLLPEWFIQRSAPEHVEPEQSDPSNVEAWLRQWRAKTPEQKAVACQGPWSLSDWLFYFDTTEEGRGDDRSWWWWHAGTEVSGEGWVQVATTGWPFETGSLSWLIEASGGSDLAYGPGVSECVRHD
ncbi:hypothetical protein [Nocardia sp. NPDC006630]|uniref:hypothetical protein n=1 Tax=Nocardia sp. NPDC006630 TaxID=3157181 RepID=UPI0033A62EB6